jgi:hypothetical protein
MKKALLCLHNQEIRPMTYMKRQPIVAYPPGDCVPFRGSSSGARAI